MDGVRRDQQIDRLGAGEMAALHQDGAGPERQQSAPLPRHIVFAPCGFFAEERRRLGAGPGWNCRDVKIQVARIAFDQLGPEREAALNAVETSFKLTPEQVDLVVNAGQDALKNSNVFRSFLGSLGRGPWRGTSAAAPGPAEAPQQAAAQ